MQLFITEFEVKGEQIIIEDSRIKEQLRKVLRAKIWYLFQVQKTLDNKLLRYTVSLQEFTNNTLVKIESLEEKTIKQDNTGVIISMLNKFDKMELIVQKLSEIGVKNIIFTPTTRSIIRVFKEKKMERIKKISLEAVEQSKWRAIPNIIYENKFSNALEGKKIFVLDMDGEKTSKLNLKDNEYLFIGPEWGITIEDMNLIAEKVNWKINIGNTVLRAETAAIIGWWLLIN